MLERLLFLSLLGCWSLFVAFSCLNLPMNVSAAASCEQGASMVSSIARIASGEGLVDVATYKDQFGYAIVAVSDMDRNGVTDLVVSADKKTAHGETQVGVLFSLMMAADGTVISHFELTEQLGGFTGPFNNPNNGYYYWGHSLANIGDINGDNLDDVAVGAINDADGGNNVGAIFLLRMASDGTILSDSKISSLNGIEGLHDSISFGSAITSLGDVNGDGNNDIAVSAFGSNNGVANNGCVWILFLDENSELMSQQRIGNGLGGLLQVLGDERFGWSLAGLNDFNGDGTPDLAVGARDNNDGGTDYGAVYILFLTSTGTVAAEQKLSATSGNVPATVFASSLPYERFGSSVCLLPDVDGNGVDDLIVGSMQRQGDNTLTNAGIGVLHLFSLNLDGTVLKHAVLSDTQLGTILSVGDVFGASVTLLDNTFTGLTGDIHIAVGAYLEFSETETCDQCGAIYLIGLSPHDDDVCGEVGDNCLNSGTCGSVGSFWSNTCDCSGSYGGACCADLCVNGGVAGNSGDCACVAPFTGVLCEETCLNGGVSDGQLHCNCDGTGFEGPYCDLEILECLSNPCNNGGTCLDGVDTFVCNCTDTYLNSEVCDLEYPYCTSSPCNAGVCSEIDMSAAFECDCTGTGAVGGLCETDIDECESSPCSHGVCDGSEVLSFTCDCAGTGYHGELCDEDVDDCASSPCTNGGTCTDSGTDSFVCSCVPPFNGTTCANDLNACASSPCEHDAPCATFGFDYSCDCTSTGYMGTSCETEIDECASSPCLNEGICTDHFLMVTCDCSGTGYEGDYCGDDIDDCASNPCENNATCVDNGANSYECVCVSGWGGSECQDNIDDCAAGTLTCSNGGSCRDDNSTVNAIVCDCPVDYTGTFCSNALCDVTNPCLNDGVCLTDPSTGAQSCDCADTDFFGDFCDVQACAVSPCVNGGTCVDVDVDTYSCTCADGFGGHNCATLLCVSEVVAGTNFETLSCLNDAEYQCFNATCIPIDDFVDIEFAYCEKFQVDNGIMCNPGTCAFTFPEVSLNVACDEVVEESAAPSRMTSYLNSHWITFTTVVLLMCVSYM